MEIKFRNKKLNIKNKNNTRANFLTHWNGYVIEITPYDTSYYSDGSRKLNYEAYCIDTFGNFIYNNTQCNSISEGLQDCFDCISEDIDKIKNQKQQIERILENVKDWL